MSEAKSEPEEIVTVFEDEASFYRQPSQSWLWSLKGRVQPKLHHAAHTDDCIREVAFMDVANGKLFFSEYKTVTVEALKESITQLVQRYPKAKKINVIWDNLPTHWHPRLMEHIQAYSQLNLVGLPTYAPWLNAMEKVWKLVCQHVTHAHPWADDFEILKSALRQKLTEYAQGSSALLRYVGLLE